jgi:heme/copper-type cytochrome/quinol oxidase subunit 3
MADPRTQDWRLPVGSIGHRSLGWSGMMMLIMSEAALFCFLLFTYYYFAAQYGRDWLPIELPSFRLSLPDTLILLSSSVAVWWGERGIKSGNPSRLAIGLALGFVLGAVFVAIQGIEWSGKPFGISSNSYGSIYFTMTGFHLAHVVGGLFMLLMTLVWTLLGKFDAERHAAVSIGAIYWHFVDAVWITIFFTIYITPHLR